MGLFYIEVGDNLLLFKGAFVGFKELLSQNLMPLD